MRKQKTGSQGLKPYLGKNELPPRVLEDMGVKVPPYYQPEVYMQGSVWIGGDGTTTGLHKDGELCSMAR